MKKYLLITLLCLGTYSSWAQSRAGLRFAPNLVFNRIVSQSDTLAISPAGTGGRLIFGTILDYPLGSTGNYFTTGLLYNPQRVGLEVINRESGQKVREVYRLQYIQIPGTFTMLTDEVALDKRLFFEVGGVFGVKVSEKPKHPDHLLIRKFNSFNLTTVIGAGMEFTMGTSTTLALGISYYRGLGNVVGRHLPLDTNLTMKVDQLTLECTVRF